MNEQKNPTPILSGLTNLELVGVTLIQGYVQFLFDGPIFNVYVLPQIKIGDKIYTPADFGYYDALHTLIGSTVSAAYENENEEKITVRFDTNIEFSISLRDEDRNSAEAAWLQLGEQDWNVW